MPPIGSSGAADWETINRAKRVGGARGLGHRPAAGPGRSHPARRRGTDPARGADLRMTADRVAK